MKIFGSFFVLALVALFYTGCSYNCPKVERKPTNIDGNNVGVTSSEDLDQGDYKIIEGNLEDNDFKN